MFKLATKFNIEKCLVAAITGGVFLVLLTPLVVFPGSVYPAGTSKAFYFGTILEITFFFYLLLVLTNYRHLPKFSWLLFIFLVFLEIEFLANLKGFNFHRSFWGSFERSEGFITHLHLLGFFIILTGVFRSREAWLKLLKFSVFASFFVSVTGLVQKFGIFDFYGFTFSYTFGLLTPRVGGSLGNPVFLSGYLVLTVFLALFLAIVEKSKLQRAAIIFIILFDFFILLNANTKASYPALLAGGVLFLFGWLIFSQNKKLKLFAVSSAVLLIFIAAGTMLVVRDNSFARDNPVLSPLISFREIFAEKMIEGRLGIAEIGFLAWQERPILGWGQESFHFLYDQYFQIKHLQPGNEKVGFDRAHNIIFDLLTASGILGFAAYFALFGMGFYLIFKNIRRFGYFGGLALAGLLTAEIVQNLFEFDSISSYIILFLALAFINNNPLNDTNINTNGH